MPERTPLQQARLNEIYNTSAKLLHYLEPDVHALARGISQEELGRRHWWFGYAFLLGMEFAANYPKLAVKVVREKVDKLYDSDAVAMDWFVGDILRLYQEQEGVDFEKLAQLKRDYQPEESAGVEYPAVDGKGRVYWMDAAGSRPFPLWEEEFQEWGQDG